MAGPKCDVCGKYILPITGEEKINLFRLPLFGRQELHACNPCKDAFPSFGTDWRNLPEGPLREAYAAEIKRREEELEDLKCEQEELEECGDLEDRLEIAQKVAEAERLLHV